MHTYYALFMPYLPRICPSFGVLVTIICGVLFATNRFFFIC
nr:MAG TPA: hypothetical protein [Caudoviricetes sp.]